MVTDLPIAFDYTRSRDAHIADHERLHLRIRDCVCSADYTTLQAAVDDAATKRRPLMIMPGAYTLTAPLLINNQHDSHIFAYGATFAAGADMSAMLDWRDCTRSFWYGGWFNVPDDHMVDNVIYVYRDIIQSTCNYFQDMVIEGAYATGVRIGQPGNGGQCDHNFLTNVELIGRSRPGQVGVYIGDGYWGNCLNHAAINLRCSNHEIHVKVDATNAAITNAYFDTSALDLSINSTHFSLRECRSEDSQCFMISGGPATGAAAFTLSDVLWNAEKLNADGAWLKMQMGGSLILQNVTVLNGPVNVTPNIVCGPGGASTALALLVDGLAVGGANPAPFANAFALTRTAALIHSYIEIGSGGGAASVTVNQTL